MSKEYVVLDEFSKGEFSWREWTAPQFSSAAALRKHLDSLNLVGKKNEELRMIGLSYMHTRDWIEESAYSHYDAAIEDENELQRLSNYVDIDPEMLYDRYAQIDEPLLIQFEDGDRLEMICPIEGKVQISLNHIPWWIDAGTNSPNEDANVLFSDCIGQVISGVEVYSYKWQTVSKSKDGCARGINLVLDKEGDSAYEVILRFENGCGLSFMAECYDYCAVYSVNRNNKANQLPFRELREGLFNREDLCIDPVTGFEASNRSLHFGKKGQEHTEQPFMTLSPGKSNSRLHIAVSDFLLFGWAITLFTDELFDEFGHYEFKTNDWLFLLNKAEMILNYASFDDLFDYLTGLNIKTRMFNLNYFMSSLNHYGATFWRRKNEYKTQLNDMRDWTALTMKENDAMIINGF